MPTDILMPSLDPSMEKARIVRWLKDRGDRVEPGDSLVEIETEKAVFEVEAAVSGVMGEMLAAEGDYAPVNSVIGLIYSQDDDKDKTQPSRTMPEEKDRRPHPSEHTSTVPGSLPVATTVSAKMERIFASPLARRLASHHGLDLSHMTGSGPHGRIVKVDIEARLASDTAGRGVPFPVAPQSSVMFEGLPEYETICHSRMRGTIARRLTDAWWQVPHYFLNLDCEVDALLTLRKELNETCDVDDRVSLNDLIVRAVAIALTQVPAVNVAWSDAAVLKFSQVDLAIAVAVQGGLITPVIRNAAGKNLLQTAHESRDLIAKAKSGRLSPNDYRGGTFTISNLGMYGIKSFTSIINPPQSAILSVGAAEKRPVVKNDALGIATLMSFTLAVDHRCVDGALAAEFFVVFKRLLEKPLLIMLQERAHG